MRQSCDMLWSDADEDLDDPAMEEENVGFLSLSIGGSKSLSPSSQNSVGLEGFFTDEDEMSSAAKGSNSHACAAGASVFSGYSYPSLSQPIDIVYASGSAESGCVRDGTKAREDWREKAWERKRDQVLLEDKVVRDSPANQKQALQGSPRARTHLANMDMDIDELKGCLDLGFGFNYDEMTELSHTLPALELCYAIGQNFQDHDHQKSSSPVSTLDGADSSAQSPIANWKISSPGDSPQEVKARLKVWAQAVACTVRLCN